MKKIFRTTMAICLFAMTMLVVNTFKMYAQNVQLSEQVVLMSEGETHDVELIPAGGCEILDVQAVSPDPSAVRVENVSYAAPSGMRWIFRLFGIKEITLTIEYTVIVKDRSGLVKDETVRLTISITAVTALNVLQPELPDLIFVIRQD